MKTLFTTVCVLLVVCGCAEFGVGNKPKTYVQEMRGELVGEETGYEINVSDVSGITEVADEYSSDNPDTPTQPDQDGKDEELGEEDELSAPDISEIDDTDTYEPTDLPDLQDLEQKQELEEEITDINPPDIVPPDTPDITDTNDAETTANEVLDDDSEVVNPCQGVACDDKDPCTMDSCDPSTGECVATAVAYCCHDDSECDDWDACNGVETCVDNKCQQGEKPKCNDDNICTDDSCDPVNGCVYTPNIAPCDDADPCTVGDICADGKCVGKTWCACFSNTDCLDDGNLCNGTYKCKENLCVIDPATVVDCDDKDPCTTDSCNQSTGECVATTIAYCCHDDSECNDWDACNGVETCVDNKCQQGKALKCDDGNVCTDDSCDKQIGCINIAIMGCCNTNDECDNGDKCDGAETCKTHKCVPGIALFCDDNNDCTADGCVPTTGCVPFNLPNGTVCNDKDACTTSDTCQSGKCKSGPALKCNDNNVCTNDSCDQLSGCAFVPTNEGVACADNNICNGVETCFAGICSQGIPLVCDDGNVCTDNLCDAAGGCVFPPNTDQCDDSNACTTGDICQAGKCKGGPAPNCNDNNLYTEDFCAQDSGCGHTPICFVNGCDKTGPAGNHKAGCIQICCQGVGKYCIAPSAEYQSPDCKEDNDGKRWVDGDCDDINVSPTFWCWDPAPWGGNVPLACDKAGITPK